MDLKIFAEDVEQSALEQIDLLSKQDIFKDSKIRIMPDVHSGKGCVIGFTATVEDKIIPNLVGVDIGCGMLCAKLGDVDISFKDLDRFIRNEIPSGQQINDKVLFDDPLIDLLNCLPELKNVDRLYKSMGSLGGGNHFIEIGENSSGEKFLIVHSGSRNLGKQVAEYYQNLAISNCDNSKLKHREIKDIINHYNAIGKPELISGALEAAKKEMNNEIIPKDLAYLENEAAQMYLEDMDICTKWARLNRIAIAKKIITELGYYDNIDLIDGMEMWHTIHNYIDTNQGIIRKGSIDASKGKKVLIPMNMRDGCIIGIGKGNEDWNNSAPHGAGRLMSRNEAKKKVTMEEFEDSMAGIITSSVNIGTLDESPMVYKNSEYIQRLIEPTVDIVDIIKPLYNFKANN